MAVSACLMLLLAVTVVNGFNVDTENFVRHRGARGSMFGFTVAEHRERGASWVLVGAPEAQTRQPGVLRGGAVYRCDASRDDACEEIPFDRTGNNNNSDGRQIDLKSEQWFGATLQSSGEDGIVVACAPRYVWFSTTMTRRDPVGTCYVARNIFNEFSEYSPCRTERSWGHHRQGSCQAGLGASISKDGERLYIGAVGSWYWQGQMYSLHPQLRLPGRGATYTEGQLFSQSLNNRPAVLATKEGSSQDDDSYMGYSVAVGDFGSGYGPGGEAAVGMPRGAGLRGKIVLYTWNLTNYMNLTGEQLGAYFGYSLCVADLDGDSRDDLVVGAPLYTDLSNNEGKYETGRIYIFYQGLRFQDRFRAFHIRDGKNSKSRFGLSLASLGDINKDGYGDIAVGAPYDGPDEKGAVYVYHGSKEGILEKASQIILAEHVMSTLSTFGFSVSGGMDLDENEYPDLVVGAYEADTAIFLRSRPVVNLGATVEFGAESKQLSLEDKSCNLIDGTAVSCTDLVACFEYSGIGVEKRLDFEIQFMLDAKKSKTPRMFFLTDEGKNVKNYTLRLEKESQLCKSYKVYIKNGIRDKLTALEAEMRYSLRTASGGSTSAGGRRRVTRSLTPVLDQSKELLRHDSISIQKNCGRDNICIPDLRLTVSPNTESYLLGSEKRLELNVFVENQGEDSFETMFIMGVPVGINYINIERVDHGAGAHDTLVQCSAPSSSNNNTLRCDLGNPLPQNRFVHFKVLLKPFHTEGMKSRYEFLIAVNSTNPEEEYTTDDNTIKIVIPIWVETETDLQGSSIPPDVFYNMSLYSANASFEGEIGPQVVHTYSVVNKGPSNIVEAEAYFVWPSYTLADEHLLYLLEAETEGPAVCEFVGDAQANPLNLRLDRKRKSYLEYHSGYSSSSGEAGATAEESFTSSRGSSSSSFSSSSSGSSSSSSSHSFSSSSSSSSRSGGSSGTARGRHNESHGGSDVSRNDHGNWLLSLTDEERERYEEEERRKRLEEELRRGSAIGSTEHWNSWESGNAGGAHIRHQSGVGRTEVHGAAVTGRDQAQWSNERRQEPGGYVHRQHWSSSEGHQGSSGGAVASGNGRERTEGASTEGQTVHRQYWNSADSHQGGRGHVATGDARGSATTGSSGTVHRQHWSSSESHHGGKGSSEVHHGGASGGGTGWTEAGNAGTGDGRYEQSWTYTSRNYSETVRKNDEAPKTFSNFTYSNTSSGDGIGDTAYGRSGHEASASASASGQAGHHHSSGSHRGIGHGGTFRHYSNWSAESGDSSARGSDNGGIRHYSFSTETSDIANSGHGSGSGHRATTQNWESRATGSGSGSGSSSSSWNERGTTSSGSGGHFSTGLEEAALGTGGFRTYVFTPQVPESSDSGLTITRGHIGANSHIGIETSDANGGQEAYDSGSRGYGSSAGIEANIRHHGGGGHSSSGSREVTHHHSSSHRTHYDSQRGGSDSGFIPPGDNVDYSQYQQGSYTSRGGHGGSAIHRQTGSSHHHSWSTETQNENDLEGNDDSSHLKLYGKFRDTGRQRRNVGDDGELESAIRCNATRCSLIRCILGPLAKGEAVNFAFRFRAWAHTLKTLGNNNAAKVSTLLATRLTKLPYIGAPNQANLRTEEVFTELVSTDTAPLRPEVVPLWVVVLSACAGAIILMLLVFLLWKCGFFKRNRPSDAPEKEPLNRNGHYQPGDEAL